MLEMVEREMDLQGLPSFHGNEGQELERWDSQEVWDRELQHEVKG